MEFLLGLFKNKETTYSQNQNRIANFLVQCDDLMAYRQHYPDEGPHVHQNDTAEDRALLSDTKTEEDEIPFVQYLLGPGRYMYFHLRFQFMLLRPNDYDQ